MPLSPDEQHHIRNACIVMYAITRWLRGMRGLSSNGGVMLDQMVTELNRIARVAGMMEIPMRAEPGPSRWKRIIQRLLGGRG